MQPANCRMSGSSACPPRPSGNTPAGPGVEDVGMAHSVRLALDLVVPHPPSTFRRRTDCQHDRDGRACWSGSRWGDGFRTAWAARECSSPEPSNTQSCPTPSLSCSSGAHSRRSSRTARLRRVCRPVHRPLPGCLCRALPDPNALQRNRPRLQPGAGPPRRDRPLVATWLIHVTGNTLSPARYLTASAAASALVALMIPDRSRQPCGDGPEAHP